MVTNSGSARPERAPSAIEALPEIVGWDVTNWSQALDFWGNRTGALSLPPARCLELGCGNGSTLTLWLGLMGHDVVCTDFGGVTDGIKDAHRRHGIADRVVYADLDARTLSCTEEFDIVVFKSVLGGIAAGDVLATAADIMRRAHRALKPGGTLLFAENLTATALHRVGRNLFGAGKHGWRYFTLREIAQILAPFESHDLTTFGFLGCFGRSEAQRRALGKLDRSFIDGRVPPSWHYVAAAVARKAAAPTR